MSLCPLSASVGAIPSIGADRAKKRSTFVALATPVSQCNLFLVFICALFQQLNDQSDLFVVSAILANQTINTSLVNLVDHRRLPGFVASSALTGMAFPHRSQVRFACSFTT